MTLESKLIEIENDQNEMIEINPNRLNYLLELFDLPILNLLSKLNEGRKIFLIKNDVSGVTLKLSVLKRIDKILQQGLGYYTDSIDPPFSKKERSILFRKSEFNADIEFADRLQVYKTERQIVNLSALAKLSNYPALKRKPQLKASLKDSPEYIAQGVRDMLYPQKPSLDDKKFLEQLIDNLATCDIFVFEYVETQNQKNKTTIDGFFISPNAIAIKRQQQNFTSEIFTLAHELAHYILDLEELDKPVVAESFADNKIEYWCNTFAFAFLVSEKNKYLLYEEKNPTLNSSIIKKLVKNHHVDHLAIFVHLALKGKIKRQEQQSIQGKLNRRYQNSKEKQFGSVLKPIYSELEKDVYRNAYLNGVIDECEVLSKFKPTDNDIDKFTDV